RCGPRRRLTAPSGGGGVRRVRRVRRVSRSRVGATGPAGVCGSLHGCFGRGWSCRGGGFARRRSDGTALPPSPRVTVVTGRPSNQDGRGRGGVASVGVVGVVGSGPGPQGEWPGPVAGRPGAIDAPRRPFRAGSDAGPRRRLKHRPRTATPGRTTPRRATPGAHRCHTVTAPPTIPAHRARQTRPSPLRPQPSPSVRPRTP